MLNLLRAIEIVEPWLKCVSRDYKVVYTPRVIRVL